VGARKTGFRIPELNIIFDSGIEIDGVPSHIFITHTHSDHTQHLPTAFVELGNMKSKIPIRPQIFISSKSVILCKEYIRSHFAFSKHNPYHERIHKKYDIIGVQPNKNIQTVIKKRKWNIEIIHCHHTIPCVGYGFSEVRNRLKKEYKGLEGKEIAKLKKSGVEITEEVLVPIMCYLGDSTEKVFNNFEVSKYPTILTECTFLYPQDKKRAKKKMHTHWDNLKPIIDNNLEVIFILYHFSARYDKSEILAFFKDKKPKNVKLWI